jgi:hypothetical protein
MITLTQAAYAAAFAVYRNKHSTLRAALEAAAPLMECSECKARQERGQGQEPYRRFCPLRHIHDEQCVGGADQ